MQRALRWMTVLILAGQGQIDSLYAADEGAEKQKIEQLISHIENLQDAKFVRNGTEYDARTAAKFLRGKWNANREAIKTAEDFIEKAASTSSTTGKPYLIRFKDGSEQQSADYLRAQLAGLKEP